MKEPLTKEIIIANNERMEIKGIGDIMLNFGRGKNTWKIIVRDVNYVPDLCTNLLSVRQITKEGHKVNFEDNVCTIRNKIGNKIAVGKLYKGMYKFETSRIENECFAKAGESKEKLQNEKLEKTEKLHRILGHVSYSNMYFLKNLGFKIKIPRNKCITCIKAKHSRKPFKKQKLQNSRKVLDLVHTDLCGPMPIPSLGGHKYFMTIIDDFSRKIFLYPLKNKSEAFEKFEDFFNLIENQMGKKVRAIRSDNGKEYINKHFRLFCEDKGIIQQKTVPYTPQQNGIAERFNRTIVERFRSMLIDANLSKVFWAGAAITAVYLLNILPRKKGKSANEKFIGEKVDIK